MQRTATHCVTLQHTAKHTATHCNTLQHTATECINHNVRVVQGDSQHVAINTLQHTATHYNTAQHTASHCVTMRHTTSQCSTLHNTSTTSWESSKVTRSMSHQHTATHCNNSLQFTATHCINATMGVLEGDSQHVTAHGRTNIIRLAHYIHHFQPTFTFALNPHFCKIRGILISGESTFVYVRVCVCVCLCVTQNLGERGLPA